MRGHFDGMAGDREYVDMGAPFGGLAELVWARVWAHWGGRSARPSRSYSGLCYQSGGEM